MMLALVQAAEQSSAKRGGNVVLFFVVVLGLIVFALRRRRSAGPPLPLPQARLVLEEMEKDGRRDPRTEGHILSFMSWCRTYAVLTAISFAAMVLMSQKAPVNDEDPPPDRGTLGLFLGVAVLEAAGLWAGGRSLAKGEDRGRWISCAALTVVALSGATAVTMRIVHWSEDDVIDFNLLLHGTVTVYALAGATFLLLPRSARLCTPEYRAAVEPVETPRTRSALQLARMKSVFSWIPLIVVAASFALHLYHKKSGSVGP
jgi:hypothetical protein